MRHYYLYIYIYIYIYYYYFIIYLLVISVDPVNVMLLQIPQWSLWKAKMLHKSAVAAM